MVTSKEPWSRLEDLSYKDPKFHSDCFQCLKIYAKFTFYLGVSPLNPVITVKQKLSVRSSLPRKVLCFLFHILAPTASVLETRKSIMWTNIKEHPSQLYRMAYLFLTTIGFIVLIRLTFVRKNGLAFLYETTYKMQDLANTKNRLTRWSVLTVMLFLIAIGPVAMIISNNLEVGSKVLEERPKDLETFSEFSLIPLYSKLEDGSYDYENGPSKLAMVIFGIHFLLSMYFMLLSICIMVLPYICCLMVNQIGVEFRNFLKTSPTASFEEIYEAYEDLKMLLSKINRAVGPSVMIAVLCGITNLSTYFAEIFSARSWYWSGLIILSYTAFLTSFSLAADANTKFQRISEYIIRNRKSPTFRGNPGMGMLLFDVSQNQLGLKAHTFTITYSFMATILSTALTYVIILLQFRTSSCK